MKKKSLVLIVAISLFVGLLHMLIGPEYKGGWPHFVRGYLIDILLPLNLYLLLQVAFRKHIEVSTARIIAAVSILIFGVTVEILQLNHIDFLGSTYDPLDIVMYALGIALGLAIDRWIIGKWEST